VTCSISGFTILGGVEWHSSGVLKERLKEMLSADQFQLSPDVLATIVSDWIDAVVRLFFLPIGVLLGVLGCYDGDLHKRGIL